MGLPLHIVSRAPVALVALSAVLLAGCGACAALQDAYRSAITQELLQVGTGRTSDAGGIPHVRIQMGSQLLARMAASVARLSPFRPVRLQRRAGSDDQSPTFLIRARYTLGEVALARTATAPSIRIQIDLAGESSVERVVAADQAELAGTALVLAPLALSDDAGSVVLDVDLRAATIEALDVAPGLQRADDSDFVVQALRSDLLRQLDEASDHIELLRVPTIGQGRGRVLLAPIGFGAGTGDAEGLTLEFVSNLRPEGASLPPQRRLARPDDFRMELADGLPMALAHHLLASALLPRTVQSPSGEDEYLILQPAASGGPSVSMDVHHYCLGPGRCSLGVDHWSMVWSPAGASGVRLQAQAQAAVGGSGVTEPLMRAMEQPLSELLSPPEFVMADGDALRVVTQRIERVEGAIVVEGTGASAAVEVGTAP